MKIFLISIKGYGLGVRIGKLTQDQIQNWDAIQAKLPIDVHHELMANKTTFAMTSAAADGASIEILDDEEELVESYEYNQIPFEETNCFYLKKESKGTYFIDQSLLKGTFFRGEIVLEEDEKFDSEKLMLQLTDYNGELYIDDVKYDDTQVEIIDFATTGNLEKVRLEVIA